MPGTIELIAIIAAATLPGAGAVWSATAILYGVQGLIYAGISIGLNLLSSLLYQPPSVRPEDVQQSSRQPLQFRTKHYGIVKASGPWIFGETKQASFHKVVCVGQGPISEILEWWIDDNRVVLDVDGEVITDGLPEDIFDGAVYNDADSPPIIEYRLGLDSETAYSRLVTEFPAFTNDHKGNNLVTLYSYQRPLDQDEYMVAYPGGINTSYRIVFKASIVRNLFTFEPEWSDNAAPIIFDYMTHRDGMRLPEDIFMTPAAIIGWQTAFNKCNIQYPLKDGGYEPQYRLWGSYSFDERPAEVIGRMLASCDGRFKLTEDGGITLDIGDWEEPDVILDDSAILGFSSFGQGYSIIDSSNLIHATFLNVEQDYQTSEADPWLVQEDIDQRGEIPTEISLIMSPSHSQARRLMKKEAYRRNPKWAGRIICNAKAIAAFNKRFVRIRYSAFDIDEVFEVTDYTFNLGENNILSNITLDVVSMPQESYEWNAFTDEGEKPITDTTESPEEVPVPTNFTVTLGIKTVSSQSVPYAILSFDPPPNPALTTEARGKLVSDANWTDISVAKGASAADSFILSEGLEYEFQVRHVTLTKKPSAWTASETLIPITDNIAPNPVTNADAVLSGANALVDWDNPTSLNHNSTFIYRSTRNYFNTATDIAEINSNAVSYLDSSLPDGTSWFWVTTANASKVESAETFANEVTKNPANNIVAKSHDFSTWGAFAGWTPNLIDGYLSGVGKCGKFLTRNAQTLHYKSTTFTPTNGTTYTFSAIVKAAELDDVRLYMNDGTTTSTVLKGQVFDLTAGTYSAYTGTPVNSGMTSLGNGFWHIWISVTAVGTNTITVLIRALDVTGNGTDGFYIDHAQVEVGSSPSGIYYRKN